MDKTIGFIDVGTNSVHMLVVRFYEGSLGTSVYSDKESVRIGQSLYSRGVIDEETIDKASIVISKFAEVAKGFGAEQVVAMATAAAREASNRADLVQAVKGCGVDLRIIPGMEEARLIRLGVLGPDAPVRTLCIDVGGGSTEIALAEGRDDLYLDSLSLGAIRLAYGSGIDQKGKVTFRQYDVLRRMVDTASYRSVGKIRELGFEKVVGDHRRFGRDMRRPQRRRGSFVPHLFGTRIPHEGHVRHGCGGQTQVPQDECEPCRHNRRRRSGRGGTDVPARYRGHGGQQERSP